MSESWTRIDATCSCIALEPSSFTVTAVDPTLSAAPSGRPLKDWLPSHRKLRAALQATDGRLETLNLSLRAPDGTQSVYDVAVHREHCGLMLELVAREAYGRARLESARYRSVATAMSKLGFGEDIAQIVRSVTAELLQLGQWDHVLCWSHDYAAPLLVAASSREQQPLAQALASATPPIAAELDTPFSTCMAVEAETPAREVEGIGLECVRLVRALPPEWIDYARRLGAKSAFAAPLVQEHHRWGTLFAFSRKPLQLSLDARLASHLIVEYAARCIGNLSTLRDREFAASSEALMRAVSSALMVSQEPLEVYRDFAPQILDHVGANTLIGTFGGRGIQYPGEELDAVARSVLEYLEDQRGDVVVIGPDDYAGHDAGNGIAVSLSDHAADWIVVLGRTRDEGHRPNDWKPRQVELLLRLRDELIERFANLSTVYRAANERLRQASHAKDQFLAMVSHELRTPLNAVLGWVRLLQGGSLDRATTERALAVIQRNAEAQAQLIEDLLDVSQIVNGQLSLELHELDPLRLARSVIEVHTPAAEAKGVTITLESSTDASQPSLHGDPQRLRQVLNNLVGNALRYCSAGDAVEVTVRSTGSEVLFEVRDNGPGIAPDMLPLIFERFQQGSAGTKRKHGGLGLGLSICRDIVHLHGGEIEVASDGKGKGAQFRVSLPRRREVPSSASGRRIDAALLEGLTILVVDDESDARELLATVLEQAGAQVISVESGRAALDGARNVDVLVADIGMPEMDGYELVSRFHAQHPNVPAVAVTAFGRDTERQRAERAGFDAHLTKPVDAERLIQTLASYQRGVQ